MGASADTSQDADVNCALEHMPKDQQTEGRKGKLLDCAPIAERNQKQGLSIVTHAQRGRTRKEHRVMDAKAQYEKDQAALKRCAPCECGGKAEWGSGFLFCSICGYETGYSWIGRGSVYEWNQKNKKRKTETGGHKQ
jgi:hypothetical protein